MNIVHQEGAPVIKGWTPNNDFDVLKEQTPLSSNGVPGTELSYGVNYTTMVESTNTNNFKVRIAASIDAGLEPVFESLTPSICTVDSSGNVVKDTEAPNGSIGIIQVSTIPARGFRVVSQALTTQGGNVVRTGVTSTVEGSLIHYLRAQRDALCVAVTPGGSQFYDEVSAALYLESASSDSPYQLLIRMTGVSSKLSIGDTVGIGSFYLPNPNPDASAFGYSFGNLVVQSFPDANHFIGTTSEYYQDARPEAPSFIPYTTNDGGYQTTAIKLNLSSIANQSYLTGASVNTSNMLLRTDVPGWDAIPLAQFKAFNSVTPWVTPHHWMYATHIQTGGSNHVEITGDISIGYSATAYGGASGVTHMKVLPVDYLNYIDSRVAEVIDLPGWCLRYHTGCTKHVRWMQPVTLRALTGSIDVDAPRDTPAKLFAYPHYGVRTEMGVGGDSGSPTFLCINGQIVLVGCMSYYGGFMNAYTPQIQTLINSLMNSMAPGNDPLKGTYALTPIDLSGFVNYG